MLENRKILTAAIGYIIGIIMGLYCNISIVPFFIAIFLIYKFLAAIKLKRKFKIFSIRRYFRYIKILITKQVLFIIILFSILSNTVVLIQNNKYENVYKLDKINMKLNGTIVEVLDEKYKVKIKSNKFKGIYLYLYIDEKEKLSLEYGDKITFEGIYSKPETMRNYKGFDYSKYLKTLKIYGIIEAENIGIIKKNDVNIFSILANKTKIYMEKRIGKYQFSEDEKSIIEGILLGDKNKISDEISEKFSKSNISYILAISGMHISYIILFIKFSMEKIVGKHNAKIVTSILILVYMFITGFQPSVVRAGIVGILVLMSNFFYRKSDLYQDMFLSLFVLLLSNPYLILSLSLQLSYLGTFGIIIILKRFKKILEYVKDRSERTANRKNNMVIKRIIKISKMKFFEILEDVILISISANIAVLPIVLINYNVINLFNIFIGIESSFIVAPILLIGFIYIILPTKEISIILKLIINVLIELSNIGENIIFNQIYFITPNILEIPIYYIFVSLICYKIEMYYTIKPFNLQRRINNIISYLKYEFRRNLKKIKFVTVILLIFFLIFKIYPKNLKINFIDVRSR